MIMSVLMGSGSRIATSFTFSPTRSFTYDGSQKTVTVTAVDPSTATYSLTGTHNATNAGSYTAGATATGAFIGSGSASWTIGQKDSQVGISAVQIPYAGGAPTGPDIVNPFGISLGVQGDLTATEVNTPGVPYVITIDVLDPNYFGGGTYYWEIVP